MKKLKATLPALVIIFALIHTTSLWASIDSASAWAQEDITQAIERGFVPADLQDGFTNVITRQEFCRMAVRWLEYATGDNIDALLAYRGLSRDPGAFTDTDDPDILAAFALGITSGVGGNRFNPEGEFSREQAATMLMNTISVFEAALPAPPPSDFADISAASSWARAGIDFVSARGIMRGTGNNNFSPLDLFTREQGIVTFNNIDISLLQAYEAQPAEENHELVGVWTWIDNPAFVTTFNSDQTGVHQTSWGFGTTFDWLTSGSNLYWFYPGFRPMYTPYRISGNSLFITMAEMEVFHYINTTALDLQIAVSEIHRLRTQQRRYTNEAMFGMVRRYTSENFYWYSNEANARWLPYMAAELEDRLPEVLYAFDFAFTYRIPIFYYSRRDMDENIRVNYYPDFADSIGRDDYLGFAGAYISVVRPSGSTVVTDNTTDWLVHETVHIIQHRVAVIGLDVPSWLIEGTASYFERYFYVTYGYFDDIMRMVSDNEIPTLAQMEDEDFFWDGDALLNYAWGATIVQFIHTTFGFEYVVGLHIDYDIEEVFGISREEFERLWHQFLRNDFGSDI